MLQLKNLLKSAINSIVKNRIRSLLTSLGIIIGVGAVIVMVAIGEGASQNIKNQIASLGTDLLVIRSGASRMGGVSRGTGSAVGFAFTDVKDIAEQATLIKAISPVVRSSEQIIGYGNNWNTSVEGVEPDYMYIKDWEMESGEFFTDRDVKARKKVCVLGKTVAEELFPGQNPVGEKIRIRKTPFKVLGVLEEKGEAAMGMDQDDIILAPATTVLYRLKGGIYVDMIYISAISAEKIYDTEAELTTIVRNIRGIKDDDEDDFYVRNQTEITEMVSSTTETLTLLLGSIAAVSLIVGGIGIMNIMLVSVTERTREIGIRLSIGARERDILTQFLTESVLLSAIGGIIGVTIAVIISVLLNEFSSLNTAINPGIILLAFFFATSIGVFFGLYPAYKAAKLNPIDALRYE